MSKNRNYRNFEDDQVEVEMISLQKIYTSEKTILHKVFSTQKLTE